MNSGKMEGPAWERFAEVADRLTHERPGVKQVKMFGAPCISVNGKGFAAFDGEGIALKLTGAAHARALALPGAHLWDPSGRGRPMREWVLVPTASAAEWDDLAAASCAYVGGE